MSDFIESPASPDVFDLPSSTQRPRGMPGKVGKKTVVTRQEFMPCFAH